MRGVRYFEHGKDAVPASLICFAPAQAPSFQHEAVSFTAATLRARAIRVIRELQREQGTVRN